jgi:hypothetical protein
MCNVRGKSNPYRGLVMKPEIVYLEDLGIVGRMDL